MTTQEYAERINRSPSQALRVLDDLVTKNQAELGPKRGRANVYRARAQEPGI